MTTSDAWVVRDQESSLTGSTGSSARQTTVAVGQVFTNPAKVNELGSAWSTMLPLSRGDRCPVKPLQKKVLELYLSEQSGGVLDYKPDILREAGTFWASDIMPLRRPSRITNKKVGATETVEKMMAVPNVGEPFCSWLLLMNVCASLQTLP
ncbi:pyridoxal phosphate phosphatase PHOSPHO2 [Lates japonicus]|uniref:Pyridoxal phosphate phosphatase PHOSPHO2 n=1 Tax=Lates japonicus TaxID=270547 RepID=A0AAD3M7P8_LATJO|nr:pyridoxal phosphate phosphatase PHOSPHO2 [Lates japonicus]